MKSNDEMREYNKVICDHSKSITTPLKEEIVTRILIMETKHAASLPIGNLLSLFVLK